MYNITPINESVYKNKEGNFQLKQKIKLFFH